VLWKHKAPFHFGLVQDKFFKEFQYIFTRKLQARVSQEALDFLKGKGICVYKDKSTYIRLYGYEGNHPFLPILLVKIIFSLKYVCSINHGLPYLIKIINDGSFPYLSILSTFQSRD
jgi:hypothetical protein